MTMATTTLLERREKNQLHSHHDIASLSSCSYSSRCETARRTRSVSPPRPLRYSTKLASNKRNIEFHAIFPDIPDHETLIQVYRCALQKEILVQGHIYVSEHHCCFKANIFGWITKVVLPFNDIAKLEKRMTAKIIPNGILITVRDGTKYIFASFMSRDQAYDLMTWIWQEHHRRDTSTVQNGWDSQATLSLEPSSAKNSFQTNHDTADEQQTDNKLIPRSVDQRQYHAQNNDNIALDATITGSVEELFQLLFEHGFMESHLAAIENYHDIMLGSWQDKKRTCFWTTANGTRYRVDDCIVEYSDRHMLVSSKLQPVKPHNYSIQRKTRLAQLDGHRVHILASFQVEPTDLGLSSTVIIKDAQQQEQAFYDRLYNSLHHKLMPPKKSKKKQSLRHAHCTLILLILALGTNFIVAFRLMCVSQRLVDLSEHWHDDQLRNNAHTTWLRMDEIQKESQERMLNLQSLYNMS